jgi:hypothetical protein
MSVAPRQLFLWPLIAGLFCSPVQAAAQDPRLLVRPRAVDTGAAIPVWQEEPGPSSGALVMAGAVGAVVGTVAGATTGYRLERSRGSCSCEDPGLMGLILGGAIGSVLAVPTAVHLANGRRGSWGRAFGTSALIGGLGLVGLFGGADSEAGLLFAFAVPIAEVALSVHIERSTARGADPARHP